MARLRDPMMLNNALCLLGCHAKDLLWDDNKESNIDQSFFEGIAIHTSEEYD